MRAARSLAGAALLAAVAGLTGCSIFSSSTAPKPAVLEEGISAGSQRLVWNVRLDSIQFPLTIAVNAAGSGQFVVAGNNGVVQALQAADGAVLWRAEVGQKLAAGVGSDGRFAAVVTRNNELVVLDAGQVLWRKTLVTPINAAPLVAGERVFVLSVDRQVLAFDVLDGRKLWELRRPGDPLTLAQAGVIAAYKDTLVVGQGARLTGVDPLKGTVRWEANVANPRGTNEVERLADLVGPMQRQGDTLCARAFQSAVGCVNGERGTALWSRNVGGVNGIGADAQYVFGADGADRLSAWKISNGDTFWTAEQFTHRKLSVPLALGETVIVGDFQGQVHFVSRETGKTQARLATDGSPIVSAPVSLGKTVLVATRNGGLFAIRAE